MSTTLSLRDANSFLKLVTEFPGAETIQWRIEELFQRDVNWPRVEQKIVPYLQDRARPQFFNSLTIALLPIQEGVIRAGYHGDGWNPPQLTQQAGEFQKTVNCGPITIGYYSNWTSVTEPGAKLGQVLWNPDQVFSVALDGQHRLAAIKTYLQGIPAELQNLTQIPVLLIILDDRVGYEIPAGAEHDTIDVLRRLFIDLNKHADKVARSRLILLDDTDPLSLCFRQTIGEQIKSGLDDVTASPPRLPLSLINWHEEKEAKFDLGPYVTSTLALDWIVKKTLRIDPIEDFTDYDRIEHELTSLTRSLGLQLDDSESITLRRLRDCERGGSAFSFTRDELAQITAAFSRVWVPSVLKLLTQFKPYADLIQARKDNDSLSVEFINWYYLKVQADKARGGQATLNFNQFISRMQNRPEDPIGGHVFEDALRAIEELKGDSLAFKVVYQRALVLAFLEFSKIKESHLEGLSEPEEEGDSNILDDNETEVEEDGSGEEVTELAALASETMQRADTFISALNTLTDSEPDFLDLRCEIPDETVRHLLWNGTLYDPAGATIDFTSSAATRAQEPMVWAAILYMLRECSHESLDGGCDTFWDHLINGDDLSRVHLRLRRSINRFADHNKGAAARILRASRADFGELPEERRVEIARGEAALRFRFIWQNVIDA